MLYGLDLFSGIGGIGLALDEWVEPLAYCEKDKYAQGVLLSNMLTGEIHTAPIWDDISTLDGVQFQGLVDIVYGGFPCQDISVAGLGAGLAGERSGLFWEVVRLVKETQSPWVFLENVPAIRTRGLKEVIGAFADMGYDCRWTSISAAEVGALHKRQRWFLLANANSTRCKWENSPQSKEWNNNFESIGTSSISHTNSNGLQGLRTSGEQKLGTQGEAVLFGCGSEAERSTYWETEPDVDRVVDGLQHRAHRIKGLGNAVVPQQAKAAFKKLMGGIL